MRMTVEASEREEGQSAADVQSAVARQVRIRLAATGRSQAGLARDMQVAPMWLSDRLTGRVQMSINDLARIADSLDVKMVDLIPGGQAYVSVGYDPSGEVDLISRIQRQVGHRSPLATTYPSGGRPPLTHPSGHGPPSGPRRTARTGR